MLDRIRSLVHKERQLLVQFLLHLNEMEHRRLYAETHSSTFSYLTGELGLSEGAAVRRIKVARLAKRFPLVLSYLADGKVHLSGLCLLAPHMTSSNCKELLDEATGKSIKAVEKLVALRFFQMPNVLPRETIKVVGAKPKPFMQKFTKSNGKIDASGKVERFDHRTARPYSAHTTGDDRPVNCDAYSEVYCAEHITV